MFLQTSEDMYMPIYIYINLKIETLQIWSDTFGLVVGTPME